MSRFVVLATVLVLAAPARAGTFLAPLVKHAIAPGGAGANGKAAPPPATPPAQVLVDVTGPAQKIDLPQLLQVAIRQSPSLASATLDVEIAAAQVDQSLYLDDWTVKGLFQGQRSGLTFLGPGVSRSASGSLDLLRTFSTGGSVDIHAESDWSHTVAPFGSASYDKANTGDIVDVSLTQPLLRGRGRAVARALQIENALLEDASTLTKRQDAINIVQSVVTGYWDLVADQRALEIAQGSLDLAKERLRVTQIGVSGGKVADSELLAVEEAIQTRQEDVINAEVAIIAQSLYLRRTIGMEIGPNQVGLDAGAELSIPERTWDLADLLNQAEHSSPQLASLAKQEQNATIVVEVTENGLLPQLDLALTIGPQGVSSCDANTPTPDCDSTLRHAVQNLISDPKLLVQGSLTFSQSIGRHQIYGQERQYRAQREKIRVSSADVRLQIGQALSQAVAQVRAAEQRVAADSKAVELAQKNILVEQSRFELGKSTNFDVLLRQDELRQAQLREARAQVDWHKAQAVIAALTGTLLADYGIELR
jgi:outer membrane protein TolC